MSKGVIFVELDSCNLLTIHATGYFMLFMNNVEVDVVQCLKACRRSKSYMIFGRHCRIIELNFSVYSPREILI